MLEQFGLNNYENKVYLALLQLGEVDARTVSSESEVPYGRIYDILESLRSKNLLYLRDGRPKKYSAVEPEIAVELLMKAKEEEIKQLQKHAEVATQQLNQLYQGKPKDELVWKVAIGDELYATYFDLLAEARKEIFTYMELNEGTLKFPEYTEDYRAIFRRLSKRGGTIKLILGVEDTSIFETLQQSMPEVFSILPLDQIRYTQVKHVGFSIIDGEKVLLKVVNPIMPEQLLAGVYLWESTLSNTMHNSFLDLWEESTPVSEVVVASDSQAIAK